MKENSPDNSSPKEASANSDVDETLVDWMLSLTPQERLEVASQTADSIQNLRNRITDADEVE